MRPWRRHVVGLVAIAFALAAGVALGGGPLSQGSDAVAPRHEPARTAETAAPDPRAPYADTLAASVAGRVYAGGLAGQGVALLALPGAEGAVVDGLAAEVAAAGGSVTASYDVRPTLLDPGEKSLVDTLGSQLAQQLTETRIPAEATAYDRVGALLGEAVATGGKQATEVGADADTIVSSLEGAGLLSAPQRAESRASLLLVVLGHDPGTDADPILEGLLTGLAGSARGVVVAGDADDASTGALARFRASAAAARVTTVDGVDGPAGRVTATLALVRAKTTRGGSFGASGADGAVPLG